MTVAGEIKKLRPITPGQRGTVIVTRSKEMSKNYKLKRSLKIKKTSISGRNNAGRITVRRRGGGHKKHIRVVDFKRSDKDNVEAVVKAIHYDPNRSAYLALICYTDGEFSYIIAPEGLKVGDKVVSGDNVLPENGNFLPLKNIPTNKRIFCIELKPGTGAKLARSAGASVQLLQKEGKYAILKLRSGEMRKVLLDCRACIGVASNPKHKNRKLGKAGANRWRGRRPTVRGVAMNPVDHPHGGGEGRTSGGRHPVSPTGVPAKGYRTRSNKRTNKFIVRDRRKK
jgi:large subunit ribosomal protein L2